MANDTTTKVTFYTTKMAEKASDGTPIEIRVQIGKFNIDKCNKMIDSFVARKAMIDAELVIWRDRKAYINTVLGNV